MSALLPSVRVGDLSFRVGSPFSLRVRATASKNEDDDVTTVHVPEGCRLSLSTATVEPPAHPPLPCSDDDVVLCLASDENPEWLPLCGFGGDVGSARTLTGLGVDVCGPRRVRFRAAGHVGLSLCLFGCVVADRHHHHQSGDDGMVSRPSATAHHVVVVREDTAHSTEEAASDRPPGKKRKHDAVPAKKVEQQAKKESANNNHHAKKEARKARTLLAAQKAVELREAVASEQGYNNIDDGKDDDEALPSFEAKKAASPYSKRRLPHGLVIQDVVVGDGAVVRAGKVASILYRGSTNGRVFDKKQNKFDPLQFRLGTGEVIRGLEQGIEGMRAGGERTLIVPPKLGYGKKGAGKAIPPHSTLEFDVRLLGVGPYRPTK